MRYCEWEPSGDLCRLRSTERHRAEARRDHGKKAIEKVAREQPAAYLKILALLVPREHKVEHRNPLKELTDEELEAMLEHLKASLEAQAQSAKVIEGEAEVVPSLPAPGSGGTKMPKA